MKMKNFFWFIFWFTGAVYIYGKLINQTYNKPVYYPFRPITNAMALVEKFILGLRVCFLVNFTVKNN